MKILNIISPTRFHAILTAFLFIIISTSCGTKSESEKSQVDELYDEVIEIHDLAMPKMADIVNLRKDAKDLLNNELEKDAPDSTKVNQLQLQIEQLDSADDAMMNWMRGFKANLEEMSEEEQIKYLKKEKDKISEVNNQMTQSISEAREVIGAKE